MQILNQQSTTDKSASDKQSTVLNRRTNALIMKIMRPLGKNAKPKSQPRLRKRGRPAAEVPSQRNLHILLEARARTYEEVGAAHGVSKQRVGQVVRRWKQYVPVPPAPKRTAVKMRKKDEVAEKKEKRIYVVSFRLTPAEMKLLHFRCPEIKSAARAARAIVRKILSL